MKTPLVVLVIIVTLAGSVMSYSLWRESQTQDEQLRAYEQHVQQLLDEVARYSQQRIESSKQLDQLGSDLAEVRSQLVSVSNQLQEAEQRIDPEYAMVEQRLRREIRNELQAQQQTPATNLKTDLLRQMKQLDPAEMSELMSLQARFGNFLQALDVDENRMNLIVDGLSNILAEENQARMDLFVELQDDNTNPRQFRRQLRSLDSTGAQSEALSFILTDEELALFNQIQADQPQRLFAQRAFTAADGTVTTINLENGGPGGLPPNAGDGRIRVEIIASDPAPIATSPR